MLNHSMSNQFHDNSVEFRQNPSKYMNCLLVRSRMEFHMSSVNFDLRNQKVTDIGNNHTDTRGVPKYYEYSIIGTCKLGC